MPKPIVSHTTESGWLISHDESGTTYAERGDTRFEVVPGGILVVWNHAFAPFVQLDLDALIEVMGIAGLRDGANEEPYTPPADRISITGKAALRLGTMAEFPKDAHLEANPDVKMLVDRININAPEAGFFTVTRILAGDREVFKGEVDAHAFAPTALLPFAFEPFEIDTNEDAHIEGLYLGTVPEGFEPGKPFWLLASFRGTPVTLPSQRFEVAASEGHWAASAEHNEKAAAEPKDDLRTLPGELF